MLSTLVAQADVIRSNQLSECHLMLSCTTKREELFRLGIFSLFAASPKLTSLIVDGADMRGLEPNALPRTHAKSLKELRLLRCDVDDATLSVIISAPDARKFFLLSAHRSLLRVGHRSLTPPVWLMEADSRNVCP